MASPLLKRQNPRALTACIMFGSLSWSSFCLSAEEDSAQTFDSGSNEYDPSPYSISSFSDEPVAAPFHPTVDFRLWHEQSPQTEGIQLLDQSRKWVAKGVEEINDSLDVFFTENFWGDEVEVDDDSGSTSLIRLYNRYDVRSQKNNVGFGVNLKLVLAHTNKRLKFIVTSEEDEEQDGGLLESDQPENDVTTALRLIFREDASWKTSFDNGIRWRGGPRAFTQFRFRHKLEVANWRSRFVQRLFWRNIDGKGLDSDWDLSYPINDNWGFSINSNGEYLFKNGFWEVGHSWRLTHHYSPKISMRYIAGLSANNEQDWITSNYQLTFAWRKLIYKDFIYFEVRPGLDFPREKDFVHQPFIYASLDYLTF